MDWRLTNQEKYLKGITLMRSTFNKKNDHAHCEFCWFTFVYGTQGYSTTDHKRWICDTCYRDFCKMFEWKIIS